MGKDSIYEQLEEAVNEYLTDLIDEPELNNRLRIIYDLILQNPEAESVEHYNMIVGTLDTTLPKITYEYPEASSDVSDIEHT